MGFVRKWLLVPALLVVASLMPRVATADLPENDGFVYMIISAPDEDFANQNSSNTILVRVGYYESGDTVLDASFVAQNVPPFALPPGKSLDDLDGNQVTVIGGFQVPNTDGGTDPHIVTPTPPDPEDPIATAVQQAIFNATHTGALDALGTNPTVPEIVDAIVGNDQTLSPDAVFSAVFSSPMRLTFSSGIATTEGEMFPHTPSGPLFQIEGVLEENDDGDVSLEIDVCRLVAIDVKPGNSANQVNWSNDSGSLKIAFLTSEGFDATQVDPSTAEIGGVFAIDHIIKDVDHDGDDDILITFNVGDLVDGGAASEDSTSLTMRALLEDGSCVEGTDMVASTH